jgi:hypothetical protein
MAKRPGVLRPRRKVDEVELELAGSRAVARLAHILGDQTAAPSDGPAQVEAPVEAVELDQPRTVDQPLDADEAGTSERLGGLHPAIAIEVPVHVDDGPEAARADPVGIMAGRDPESPENSRDEWRSAADAYVLAQAFGIARGAVGDRAADAPVREEAAKVGATRLTPDAGAVDGRPAAPADAEPGAAGDAVSDAASSNRARASRGTLKPLQGKEGQLRGSRPRQVSANRAAWAKAAPALPAGTGFCPYCALPLRPPPEATRSCPRCRQRIIVKRLDGRAVALTEAAVFAFEAELQRIASSPRWARERQRWLKLAAAAGAPAHCAARLEAARLSEDVVEAARSLYMTSVKRSFRSAKRDRRWKDASQIRREHAAALFRLAGSPSTPPEEIVKLQREGAAAELRGIAEIARDAELVSADCCDACRADHGLIFRIAQELRVPRLPHDGCPTGLCGCRWDLAGRDKATLRRLLRRRARTTQHVGPTEPASTV